MSKCNLSCCHNTESQIDWCYIHSKPKTCLVFSTCVVQGDFTGISKFCLCDVMDPIYVMQTFSTVFCSHWRQCWPSYNQWNPSVVTGTITGGQSIKPKYKCLRNQTSADVSNSNWTDRVKDWGEGATFSPPNDWTLSFHLQIHGVQTLFSQRFCISLPILFWNLFIFVWESDISRESEDKPRQMKIPYRISFLKQNKSTAKKRKQIRKVGKVQEF